MLRFGAGNIAFCYKNWSVLGHKRLPPVRPEQAAGLQEMLSERLLVRRAWQTRGRAFLNSSSPLTLPSVAASQTLVLSQTLLPWRPWLLWQVSRSHSPTNRSLPAAPEICNPPDFLFYFFLRGFRFSPQAARGVYVFQVRCQTPGSRAAPILHLHPVSLRNLPPSIPAPGLFEGFLFEAPHPPLPSPALPSASTACHSPRRNATNFMKLSISPTHSIFARRL